MDGAMFLTLLLSFSTISSLVTEGIKNLIGDKKISYNILALVVAIVIGGFGMGFYYQLSGISFTTNNIIYLILMGVASGLTSMVGYDKVKEAIGQLHK